VQDRLFGEKCLGWLSPDEPAPELMSGEDTGFEVLVLPFPPPTDPDV